MNEIEYQSNGQPYSIDIEDLREKLGYKVYKPRIGNVGKALVKAINVSKSRSIGWLKHQLDELFKKDRSTHFSKRKKNHNANKK